jgi:hypothetical protein
MNGTASMPLDRPEAEKPKNIYGLGNKKAGSNRPG